MAGRSMFAAAMLATAVACSPAEPPRPPWDLSRALIPAETVVAAGDTRTALTPIDQPVMITPAEVERRNAEQRGKLLVGDDRVIGIVVAGQARAYPLRLLRWHEVVNDTIAGTALCVSYSPLSDSVVVFRREVAGQVLSFAHSGLLSNSTSLLVDRTDHPSLWSPLQARAVAGPAASTPLQLLPADVDTWGGWQHRFPATEVLAPVPSYSKRYTRDPYHSYFGSDVLRFPVDPMPPPGPELGLKHRVVVVDVDDDTAVFALSRLAHDVGSASGTWHGEVGGVPVSVAFDQSIGTAVVEVPTARRLAVRTSFWFAWYAMSPERSSAALSPRPDPLTDPAL